MWTRPRSGYPWSRARQHSVAPSAVRDDMLLRSILLGALIAVPAIAAAQPTPPREATRSTEFVLDNDFLALRGAGKADDFDYTHGARISVSWLGAPDLVRRA